jgi:hypothetical protein
MNHPAQRTLAILMRKEDPARSYNSGILDLRDHPGING